MLRVAIASCCKLWQDPKHHGWGRLAAEHPRPDWLLLLGDNVYLQKRHARALTTGRTRPRAVLTAEYERLFAEPSFRSIVGNGRGGAGTRLLATWDDHDFGGDDVNGAEAPYLDYRDETRALFLEYLAGAGGPRNRINCSVTPARGVRIIVTDGRFDRTAPQASHPTMFGAQQEAWVIDELARPEPLKIIVSGSCLGPGAKKRYQQGWDLYPAWLERFRTAILRHHAAGRRHLMVSGDIHRNRIVDHARSVARFPLLEVISSGVCRRRKNWNPWSTPLQNYGLLDVRTASIDIQLKGNLPRDQRRVKVDRESWRL